MSGTFDVGWPETASRGQESYETCRRPSDGGGEKRLAGVVHRQLGMKKVARGMRSEVLSLREASGRQVIKALYDKQKY